MTKIVSDEVPASMPMLTSIFLLRCPILKLSTSATSFFLHHSLLSPRSASRPSSLLVDLRCTTSVTSPLSSPLLFFLLSSSSAALSSPFLSFVLLSHVLTQRELKISLHAFTFYLYNISQPVTSPLCHF
ncbi:hypothetical protein ACOSQ2_016409 [Xanthoceras sorbifolium]